MAKSAVAVEEMVEQALEFLRERISIDAAVLFGSYVNGVPHDSSDIDLAVFSEDADAMSVPQRIRLATEVRLSCGLEVELHLYPKTAFQEARPTNFYGYILKTGRRIA